MQNRIRNLAHISVGNSDVEMALRGLLEFKSSLVDIYRLIKPLDIEKGITEVVEDGEAWLFKFHSLLVVFNGAFIFIKLALRITLVVVGFGLSWIDLSNDSVVLNGFLISFAQEVSICQIVMNSCYILRAIFLLECSLVVENGVLKLAKVVIGIPKANYSLELIFVYLEGLKVVFDSLFNLVKFVANVGESYESKGKPVVHL